MLARLRNLTTALLLAVGLLGATAAWAADPVVFAAASTKQSTDGRRGGKGGRGRGRVELERGRGDGGSSRCK